MLRSLFSAALLIVSLTSASAQEYVPEAKWHAKQTVIDGSNSEWAKPLNFFDGSTGFMFAIANDSSNLYLSFTCNDEMKMRLKPTGTTKTIWAAW
jgi:hypothetical protein